MTDSDYIPHEGRRWFEDRGHKFAGRYLEVYAVRGAVASAHVHWAFGRPRGTRTAWYGNLSTLETEALASGFRKGQPRYRELEGQELVRARLLGEIG